MNSSTFDCVSSASKRSETVKGSAAPSPVRLGVGMVNGSCSGHMAGLAGFGFDGGDNLGMQLLNSISAFKARAFVNASSKTENDGLRRSDSRTNFLVGQTGRVNFTKQLVNVHFYKVIRKRIYRNTHSCLTQAIRPRIFQL
jgi:hypothetical protein